MKYLTYMMLVAAGALAMSVSSITADPGDERTLQEDDAYQPILPDMGDGEDGGGYRPEWANPNPSPSEIGVNEDPTPFDPSDPVGIPSNQD